MYLIDTNVISEARKRDRSNPGVRKFFEDADRLGTTLSLSVVTIGELRRGVELSRNRGDSTQAEALEHWLDGLLVTFEGQLLPVDLESAQLWGRLRASHPEHALDKLIAATAILYGLTVVTRNERDFARTGAKVLNPFCGD